jgi:hypothetical protein
MSHRVPLVDGLLHFASTSRTRSVVTAAAVSFAVCHFVVLATASSAAIVADNLDAELPRQLLLRGGAMSIRRAVGRHDRRNDVSALEIEDWNIRCGAWEVSQSRSYRTAHANYAPTYPAKQIPTCNLRTKSSRG